MRSALPQLALVAVLAIVSTGCKPRLQGVDGFVGATTPVDYAAERQKPDSWKGDPYANGGLADSSGGQKSQTSYGLGARKDSTDPIDPKLNQPAKGTGHNPGEFPPYADPSYGNSNAPVAQPAPGAAGPVGSDR